jgi:hypothetical protein
MDVDKLKKDIIFAGRIAVEELIKVAKQDIIGSGEEGSDLSADRLKNAAATKKLAIFDAFEILERINEEENELNNSTDSTKTTTNFAEGRAKGKK